MGSGEKRLLRSETWTGKIAWVSATAAGYHIEVKTMSDDLKTVPINARFSETSEWKDHAPEHIRKLSLSEVLQLSRMEKLPPHCWITNHDAQIRKPIWARDQILDFFRNYWPECVRGLLESGYDLDSSLKVKAFRQHVIPQPTKRRKSQRRS